jgi:hypothetical protein
MDYILIAFLSYSITDNNNETTTTTTSQLCSMTFPTINTNAEVKKILFGI